ncbi:protein FAF-like, chloroplastic [Zingiber officinale]|nr:protein FAF-like, chloroplastic [Zingiber officinale]
MPLAVMQRSPAAASFLDRLGWQTPADKYISDDDCPDPPGRDEEQPGQMEVWSAIQCQKDEAAPVSAPYVHPLVRRSSSSLSQRSLKICTESLGSETGSDDFFSFGDGSDLDLEFGEDENEEEVEDVSVAVAAEEAAERPRGKELTSVNYHCSISMRSPVRSFPPPLPSISQRDGRCIHMRPHRRDGRLVVEAVSVPSQNYLHAQRVDGRLLLSFIEATYGDEPGYDEFSDASQATTGSTLPRGQEEEHDVKERQIKEEEEIELDEEKCYEEVEEKDCYEEEEEEEEEEVEVVDRGTMVEVKVSTQPQKQTGTMKVHRSSLVINKFIGGMPSTDRVRTPEIVDNPSRDESKPKHTVPPTHLLPRRASPPTTSAAAAAAAAASTLGSYRGLWLGEDHIPAPDTKLLFTAKRQNLEGLLHDMRRCSQLWQPLFIWEPWCIATSS